MGSRYLIHDLELLRLCKRVSCWPSNAGSLVDRKIPYAFRTHLDRKVGRCTQAGSEFKILKIFGTERAAGESEIFVEEKAALALKRTVNNAYMLAGRVLVQTSFLHVLRFLENMCEEATLF